MAKRSGNGRRGKGRGGPGRPIGFDRREAVRAAMEEFWRKGFDSASVSDLAEAMSITRSSFYNSFGDKGTVFREALREYAGSAPDAVLARTVPGTPVKPVVRALFGEICRIRASDPEARGCLVVNSVAELVGVNRDLSEEIAERVLNSVERYERLLAEAVAQGEIEPIGDLHAAAQAFVAFVCGLNLISRVVRDECELRTLAGQFLGRYGFGED